MNVNNWASSKLTIDWTLPPAARVAEDESAVSKGQAPAALLLRGKTVGTNAGLSSPDPAAGGGKISGALPLFSTVIISGLSLLVRPTLVVAKLAGRVGVVLVQDAIIRVIPNVQVPLLSTARP